jgi:hypothetical protein
MTPQDISSVLTSLFGNAVQNNPPDCWQVEVDHLRLLILLSEDQSWLRVLVSITSAQDARPFLEKLLEANFDLTQETRYALYQDVLWGVFQHARTSLTPEDLRAAIARLTLLQQQGLNEVFNQFVESQIREIIQVAKQQDQSLETTLQTLERFYEEGVMGDLNQNQQQRQETLAAWRYQLERLWSEMES